MMRSRKKEQQSLAASPRRIAVGKTNHPKQQQVMPMSCELNDEQQRLVASLQRRTARVRLIVAAFSIWHRLSVLACHSPKRWQTRQWLPRWLRIEMAAASKPHTTTSWLVQVPLAVRLRRDCPKILPAASC